MRFADRLPFLIIMGACGYMTFTGGQPEYGISADNAFISGIVAWIGYQITSAIKEQE